MADTTQTVGLNATDYINTLQRMVNMLSQYNITIDDVTKQSVKFDRATNTLVGSFTSISSQGQKVVTNIKSINGEMQKATQTISEAKNAADRFSKIQIAPSTRTDILKQLGISPAMLNSGVAGVANLQKAIRDAVTASSALRAPDAFILIGQYAQVGRDGVAALTREENKLADTLLTVSQWQAQVNAQIREQRNLSAGTRLAQSVRIQAVGISGMPTAATQAEIRTFEAAMVKLQVAAKATGLTFTELSKIQKDFSNGVIITRPTLQDYVKALEQVKQAAIGLGASATQAQKLPLALKAMETVRTALGKLPAGATTQDIANVNAQLLRLGQTIASSTIPPAQALAIVLRTLKGDIQNLSGDAAKIQNAALSLGNNFAKTTDRITKDTERATARFRALQQEIYRIGSRFAALTLNQVFYKFTAAIRESFVNAEQFSMSLGEIGTISQRGGVSLTQFSEGILAVSNASGLLRRDVSEGLYQTLSNQIGDATQSLQFMTDAANFAITTQSTMAESVNLLSSVINSFGINVNQAEKISATLFKTIELGRLRARDIADTFGTVGVIAHQVGVTFEEVAAALAVLTINGITASNAQTFLRNMILQLIKPTTGMVKLLKSLGFETGEQAIAALGFAGVVREIAKASGGASDELKDLFSNIRSIQGVLPLVRGMEFEQTLAKFGTAQHDYAAALKIMHDNTGFQFRQLRVTIENEFLKIGDVGITFVTNFVKYMGGTQQAIAAVESSIITLGTTFAGFKLTGVGFALLPKIPSLFAAIAVAFRLSTLSIQANWIVFRNTFNGIATGATTLKLASVSMAASINIIATAVAAAIGTLIYLKMQADAAWTAARQSIIDNNNLIMAAEKRFGADLLEQFTENARAISQAVAKQLQPIRAEYLKLQDSITADLKLTKSNIVGLLGDISKSQEFFINGLENLNRRNIDEIGRIREDHTKKVIAFEEEAFAAAIERLSIEEQIRLRNEYAQELITRATEETRDANRELLDIQEKMSTMTVQDQKILFEETQKRINNTLKMEENQFKEIADLIKKREKLQQDFAKRQEQIEKDIFQTTLSEVDNANAAINSFFDKLQSAIDQKAKGPLDKFTNNFLKNAVKAIKTTRFSNFLTISPLFMSQFSDIKDFVEAAGKRELSILVTGAIDPTILKVINSLDPRIRKRLAFDIKANPAEAKKLLDIIKQVADAQTEAEKVALNLSEAGRVRQKAAAAGKIGEYEEQRRLLEEAATLTKNALSNKLLNAEEIKNNLNVISGEIDASFTKQIGAQTLLKDAAAARLKMMDEMLMREVTANEKIVGLLRNQNEQRDIMIAKATTERQTFNSLVSQMKAIKIPKDAAPKDIETLTGKFSELTKKIKESSAISNLSEQLQVDKLLDDATAHFEAQLNVLGKTVTGKEKLNDITGNLNTTQKAQGDIISETTRRITELIGQEGEYNKKIFDVTKQINKQKEVIEQMKGAQEPGVINIFAKDAAEATKQLAKLKPALAKYKASFDEIDKIRQKLVLFNIIMTKVSKEGISLKDAVDYVFTNMASIVSAAGIKTKAELGNFVTLFKEATTENSAALISFTDKFALLRKVVEATSQGMVSYEDAIQAVFKNPTNANLLKTLGISDPAQLNRALQIFAAATGTTLSDISKTNIVTFDDMQNKMFETFRKSVIDNAEKLDMLKILDLNKVQKAFGELNIGEQIFKDTKAIQDEINLMKKKIDEFNATELTINNTQSINSMKEIEAQIMRVRKLLGLPMTTEEIPMPEEGKARGGLVGGRFNTSGPDNTLTALRTGEFVINPTSTKRFYNDLVNINRGTPRNMSSSTNNSLSMGGIHITLQGSGSNETDARELAKELRKLVKRGVISLS